VSIDAGVGAMYLVVIYCLTLSPAFNFRVHFARDQFVCNIVNSLF